MRSLTVAVLAFDEERMIARAIASASFADEVLVVDGGSVDATVAIAEHAGARVIGRPFDDFARQRNYALEQASSDWVLFVDADERVSPALAAEVRALLDGDATHDAYAVARRNMVLGRWLSWEPFGAPDAPVRLLRRGTACWAEPVHEVVEGARSVGRLSSELVHLTHRSVSEIVRKVDRYSELEAADLVRTGKRAPSRRTLIAAFPKEFWRLWRSGLRHEGMAGAIEAALLAFNRTLVLAKVWERTAGVADAYARAEDEIGVAGEADAAGRGRGLPLR